MDDNAIKSIASDYINLLVKKPGTNGVWDLFQALDVYTQELDLVVLHDKTREDWLVETFLEALFNSIKGGNIRAYHIKEHFGEQSPWAVTYEHLFGDGERYNLSFLVMKNIGSGYGRLWRTWVIMIIFSKMTVLLRLFFQELTGLS